MLGVARLGGGGQAIVVRHNIEVAHRLSLLPGKCEAIHGHSMWVELTIGGPVDERGLLASYDFGTVKSSFRGMLDNTFDHHLLLNRDDELAELDLPGLVVCDGDPTTENIARWVGEWAHDTFVAAAPGPRTLAVRVNETHVNAATWEWRP